MISLRYVLKRPGGGGGGGAAKSRKILLFFPAKVGKYEVGSAAIGCDNYLSRNIFMYNYYTDHRTEIGICKSW